VRVWVRTGEHCVYMCAHETKERGRRRDEGEREWRKRGMTGVSSRAGEITHFDGIKMSVFPTPICGEIARNRVLRRREKERERERERERTRQKGGREESVLFSFLADYPYEGEGWLFYAERKKRKVPRSRWNAFLDVVQDVILRRISERGWKREEGREDVLRREYYFASILFEL